MPAVVINRYPGRIPEKALERATGRLLRACGATHKELGVLITGDEEIARINKRWLGRKGPTNVISFSQEETTLLGDIVISADTAKREASDALTGLSQRLTELLIHGLVHLLGEDHETGPEGAERMQKREQELRILLNKENTMADLCINVDHIATIRQARGGDEPDPVAAAAIVELAGADGVVVHLREDRRHIQDRDVRLIRETAKTRLTLEMAATDEMIAIAAGIKPDIVTLVPEKRQELTTEGGLDVAGLEQSIGNAVSRLNDSGIPVSLFVDPEEDQIKASRRVGAQCIEIHTGRYAEAKNAEVEEDEFEQIVKMASLATDLGLRVHAGHGLNYRNTGRLAAISEIVEFSIGHAIIARAAFTGLDQAVREMLKIVKGI